MYKNYTKILCGPPRCVYKFVLIMKLTTIILIMGLMQVSAAGLAQKINFSRKDVTLRTIFTEIRKQTGYNVLTTADELYTTVLIDADFKQLPLEEVLNKSLSHLPLDFKIEEKSVIVFRKKQSLADKVIHLLTPDIAVHGTITGETGPLSGVTIVVKRTGKGVRSKADGSFTIDGLEENDLLIFSSVGYQNTEIPVKDVKSPLVLVMKLSTSALDEVHVLAYGQKTNQRLNTGSTFKVDAATIAQTPSSDPIATLQARVPGLLITNNSGLPGAETKVQIRGINTLNLDGRAQNPLYIVDGVPFTSGSLGILSNIGESYGSSFDSPFKSIDPSSIANIEILKDADATAIYGARGANGVILITTKRGRSGRLAVNADFYTSMAKVPHFVKMYNTQQYLEMRREGAANDGVEITEAAYPDLLKWSATDNTDWQKKYIGGTAYTQNAELSLSGGSAQDRFLLSGGYRNEKTVYNNKKGLLLGNTRLSYDHSSKDNKFTAAFSLNYSSDRNSAIAVEPSSFVTLPPNYPLYNADGSLNWLISNPEAFSLKTMENKTKNLNTNLLLGYKVLPDLAFKASIGYTRMQINQKYQNPGASQDPTFGTPTGSNGFTEGTNKAFTFEPMADYTFHKNQHTLHALLGGTYIDNNSEDYRLSGFLYTDDAQLGDIRLAPKKDTTQTQNQYRFLSAFMRLSYDYANKYILNVTLRRDGSSRFAPERQFGNFWSAGTAWIFSEENWFKNKVSFLSMAKLRGSYGTTGSDNVGDYSYFVNYAKTYSRYQSTGYAPTNLYNPDYQWEVNKKMDLALELGFLHDKISFSVDYYRNISNNQLVSYALGAQTGFSGVTRNLDAKIQNSGWEFFLSTAQISNKNFSWRSSFNFTIARNKLLAYANLEGSSYAKTYAIDRPLSLQWGNQSSGVDPATGKLIITDQNGDGIIQYPDDTVPLTSTLPDFYGGLSNSFTYKNLQLDIFFSFKKTNPSYFTNLNSAATLENYPLTMIGRWQHPGQQTNIPAYTTNSVIIGQFNDSMESRYDASYIRLATVSLQYDFPAALASKIGLKNLRVYTLGNNLFTITRYPGFDPETGLSMPTLRSLTFGIKTTF